MIYPKETWLPWLSWLERKSHIMGDLEVASSSLAGSISFESQSEFFSLGLSSHF